jgi:hypothetical protein
LYTHLHDEDDRQRKSADTVEERYLCCCRYISKGSCRHCGALENLVEDGGGFGMHSGRESLKMGMICPTERDFMKNPSYRDILDAVLNLRGRGVIVMMGDLLFITATSWEVLWKDTVHNFLECDEIGGQVVK